jgi:hypothetical protein
VLRYAIALLLLLAGGTDDPAPPQTATAPPNPSLWADVAPNQRLFRLRAELAAAETSAARAAGPMLVQVERGPACDGGSERTGVHAPVRCTEGDPGQLPIAVDCGTAAAAAPAWRRARASEAETWGPWQLLDLGACPVDELPALTLRDFQELPIGAPVLRLQPDRGWVLVNTRTVVTTDPAPRTFTTTLLGHAVEVVATPVRYTYEFGDGSRPLVTTSAGHAWPQEDTFHSYGAPAETAQVRLTTEWTGRYRLVGSNTWRTVDGRAVTSAVSTSFQVLEARSHLVRGSCQDYPDDAGC